MFRSRTSVTQRQYHHLQIRNGSVDDRFRLLHASPEHRRNYNLGYLPLTPVRFDEFHHVPDGRLHVFDQHALHIFFDVVALSVHQCDVAPQERVALETKLMVDRAKTCVGLHFARLLRLRDNEWIHSCFINVVQVIECQEWEFERSHRGGFLSLRASQRRRAATRA